LKPIVVVAIQYLNSLRRCILGRLHDDCGSCNGDILNKNDYQL
jgi:hypothetical protein